MNDINTAWLALYMTADDEKRKASKAYWIKVFQESIRDENADLMNLAEHRLAMMTMIEFGEEK